jgi:hypothetical protein
MSILFRSFGFIVNLAIMFILFRPFGFIVNLADYVYPVKALWFYRELCRLCLSCLGPLVSLWTYPIMSILFRPFGFIVNLADYVYPV